MIRHFARILLYLFILGAFESKSQGIFSPPIQQAFNYGFSRSCNISDVNQDGKADLISLQGNRLQWCLNQGLGIFSQPNEISSGTSFQRINYSKVLLGYMDQDSLQDIVVAANNKLWVLRKTGPSTFATPMEYASFLHPDNLANGDSLFDIINLITADFNDDNVTDFFGTVYFISGCFGLSYEFKIISNPTGTAQTIFGTINIGSSSNKNWIISELCPIAYQTFKLNHQNTPYYCSENTLVTLPQDTLSRLLEISSASIIISVGNFAGDDLHDILVSQKINYDSSALMLRTNQNGDFSNQKKVFAFSGSPYLPRSIFPIDLNGDGIKDILIRNGNEFSFILSLGNGQFTTIEKTNILIPASLTIAAIYDFNGDGREDVLMCDYLENKSYVLLAGKFDYGPFSIRIYYDKDQNCAPNESGYFFGNQFLSIQPGNLFLPSDSRGEIRSYLPKGKYKVSWLNSASFFNATNVCIFPSDSLIIDSVEQIKNLAIGVQGIGCARIEPTLKISQQMVPCRKSNHFLTINNIGFETANEINIRVRFPEYSNPLKITKAFGSPINGVINSSSKTIQFSIPVLNSNQNQTFVISDSVSCLQGLQGISQCVEVEILNYSGKCEFIPTLDWDGSDLVSSLNCNVSNASELKVKNQGASMLDSSELQILRSDSLVCKKSILLSKGEVVSFNIPLSGTNLTAQIKQRPGHPLGWTSSISIPCYTSPHLPSGNVSSFDKVFDCTQLRTSFDPNDKLVSPKGIGNRGIVPSKVPLKYTIRFMNKGTVYAKYVQIKDTLSSNLDLNTLRLVDYFPKHNYQTKIEGTPDKPIFVFTFPNTYLYDSATYLLGSQGYVTFEIKPKEAIAQNTVILNRASIVFDNNPEILTSYTITTINDSIPEAKPVIVSVKNKTSNFFNDLAIYPNPSTGLFTFKKESIGTEIQVLNALGQITSIEKLSENLTIDLSKHPNGLYIYRIWKNNSWEIGKLVKE